jgi:hypothetical protein
MSNKGIEYPKYNYLPIRHRGDEMRKYKFNGKEIELTQEAYPAGGTFPYGKEYTYNGSWYEASAEDENGEEYLIYWTNVNWDVEDELNACDWDNPDYIIKI